MKHLQQNQVRKSNRKKSPPAIAARWLLTLCTCLLMLQASATIRRVDNVSQATNPNGSSWANAYRWLQDAIDASGTNDEVWIKAGNYNPNYFDGNQYFFVMKTGVKIYGGFDGAETALNQRDPVANKVLLRQTTNLYPVIANNNVGSTALLDGVTIDGYDVSQSTTYFSAGINNTGSSFPTLNNIIFQSCIGRYGGALYIEGGTSSITNVTFSGNSATLGGGAAYFKNCSPKLTNVLFTGNQGLGGTGFGGAVYSLESAPVYTNVVFVNNSVEFYGGAVYNVNTTSLFSLQPIFNNVLFLSNLSRQSQGGAVYNSQSNAKFINCSFYKNYCGEQDFGGGGAIYATAPLNTPPANLPIVTITNCLFNTNGYSVNDGATLTTNIDVANTRGSKSDITYSSFNEATTYPTPTYPGTGNTPTIASPFVNASNGPGSDGKYFTADDGFQLNVCTAGSAIDKGNSNAVAATVLTDMAGQPRKFDVPLIADNGAGTGFIVDMGAYENQTNASASSITGTIGTSHIVPYPKELATDNITGTNPTIGGTITYSWQQRTDVGNWVTIAGATNATYPIPNISQTTYYRRGVATSLFCNTPFYTDSVKITVANNNGKIGGYVRSGNGTGVPGVKITVVRQTAITDNGVPSAPTNYTYPFQLTTAPDGRYDIDSLYYGSSANFVVTASLAGHDIAPTSISRTLNPSSSNQDNVNFTDNTSTGITGRTYQQCTNCLAPANGLCPIDSVLIYKGPNQSSLVYAATSGLIGSNYGSYAITVPDPSTIILEPRFTGHVFNPLRRTETPSTNLTNIDFTDTTTHVISGKISAGCTTNNYIGTAVLEFNDVLPNGQSCFRRQVTTAANTGVFSIRLPARKYKVTLMSFTPATGANAVTANEVITFFNSQVPAELVTRNISTRDTVLNLIYVRPPVIDVYAGLNTICTSPQPYALIKQAAADSFKIKIYQGPVALGCPLSDTTTKIKILTNVQQEDQMDSLFYAVADTGRKVKLVGGTPNITGNHLKDLFVYFTDKYGRQATTLNRKVLVTGVKADAATFTTVSPEVPLVVLHDPPGDGSFSNWQTNHSITNATRFYTASGRSTEGWIEAKIGAKLIVGLGVATEISAWGTIRGSIGVSSTSTSGNEAIITTTTSQNFSTSTGPSVTGDGGDVYVGAALNLVYAVATEIGYSNCGVTSNRRLIVANNGFATQYIYTEDFILNTLIPNLQELASLSPDSAAKYTNQIKVWQQVVENNNENKRRAAFVENKSFSGDASVTNSTTTSSSKTSTLEFAAEVNAGVAAELGFEISGSGLSGGVNVNFKMETGSSESNTVTDETTIGYTLADDNGGDHFSVNVKTDPVYNTPVFELVAGTSSCPAEPGTQARDDVYFTALNPVVQNVAGTDYANFSLRIVNTSPSHETRTYRLAYDQGTNVANESVRIAGTDYTGIPITLAPLAYLDSTTVIVSIKRLPGSSVYAYEGERFKVLDACATIESRLSKTVQVSAYYVSPCSSIALTQPADGWQLTSSGNNQIFIKPSGYDSSTLTSVNVQYATGTGNNWTDGPFLTNAQLASGFNFDASALPEGVISIRLRLDCNSGTIYSLRSTGFIDRKAPQLFGRPSPTDDNYVNGDIISFTYNENLNTNGANVQVMVRRLSNGQLIPATASIFENKIIITPTNSITGLNGDSIRVIVSGISDVYGNVRTNADTTRFIVGTTVPGTGNQALTVSLTNPTVYKNGDSSINVFFNLPVYAANDTRVNYTISGTARFGIDYTVVNADTSASYVGFNGATGSSRIASGNRQALLRIKPLGGDTSLSPDKTVIISLTEGGDYVLGATTSATGSLTSEDGITTYTFIGDGNFNIRNNWLNSKMPLTTLVAPKEIIINPSGTCVLNVKQTIRPGAKITVKQNRRMIIQGSLKQQ